MNTEERSSNNHPHMRPLNGRRLPGGGWTVAVPFAPEGQKVFPTGNLTMPAMGDALELSTNHVFLTRMLSPMIHFSQAAW